MAQAQPLESRELHPRAAPQVPGPAKAGDVTPLAALVVLAMILAVTLSTVAVTRYLRGVIDAAGRRAPPPKQRRARQLETKSSPA